LRYLLRNPHNEDLRAHIYHLWRVRPFSLCFQRFHTRPPLPHKPKPLYGSSQYSSSSGLGLATAVHLLSKGAYVSILDLNPPPSSAIPTSETHIFTNTNVTSSDSIAAAVKATAQWIEKTQAPLGGIIACAGIGTPERILPKGDMMSMKTFDRVISVNLRGTVDLLRQALPILAKVEPEQPDGERGVVIVVSSVAAYEGQVGQVAYSASKGAVASMVLPMARELARTGVRVLGIAPGVFESGMTLKGGMAGMVPDGMAEFPKRMGQGSEFAGLVGSCLENSMLNGTVVRIDAAARFPARL
jgi:NAD(P)-dependent dehydrogenase (short-subunit alcohol dehydrogenase family)